MPSNRSPATRSTSRSTFSSAPPDRRSIHPPSLRARRPLRLLAAALLAGLACSSGLLLSSAARAQQDEAVPLAVFPVAIGDASLEGLANPLSAALLAELRRFEKLQVAARPALDLPGTLLALGCDESSDECLRGATGLAHTQALLAPSVQKRGDAQLEVTVLYFDALDSGSRSITRTFTDSHPYSRVLDGIGAVVRELLAGPQGDDSAGEENAHATAEEGDQPAPGTPAAAASGAPQRPTPVSPPEASSGLPVVPLVLSAAGTALLGTGVAFGLLANGSKRSYRDARPATRPEIEAVADTLTTARRQAALCNWSLALGGALLATGVTLWIVDDANSQPQRDVARATTPRRALLPAFSAQGIGLAFHQQW